MRRRRWLRWAGSVALATVLAGHSTTSCSPSTDATAECTGDRAPYSLRADDYADVGKLGSTKKTGRSPLVIFDEKHTSLVGQVEIALMLNRLYHDADLRHLGLEGSVREKPPPNPAWFTSLPDADARTAVALQMLRQGEVSAAEFAAMVLPSFQLHPIERDSEYRVELSSAASSTYVTYLVAIALTTITPDEYAQAEALLAQNKNEEGIELIIGTDEWTNERYELLERKTPPLTTEEMLDLGAELEQKAQEVSAEVAKYRADFQAALTFFDAAARRSETMAANTVDLATAEVGECALIAMDIGAAHTTEVTDFLDRKNASYAVVSPLSLSSGSDNGSLPLDVYDRKLNGQSVDPAGALGALLDGRQDGQRKPPPSIQQAWFRSKAHLNYATVVIARAAAEAGDDDEPPFDLDQEQLGLGGSGTDAPGITVDLSSVRWAEDGSRNVIFKATLGEDDRTLWVRTGVVDQQAFSTDDRNTLERALMRMRNELLQERAPGEPGPPPQQPPAIAVSPDVKAAISESVEPLETVSLI